MSLLKPAPEGEVNNSEGQNAGRFHKTVGILVRTILLIIYREYKTMIICQDTLYLQHVSEPMFAMGLLLFLPKEMNL